MYLVRRLLSSFLLVSTSQAQVDWPREFTYVTKLGGTEIGRDDVKLTESGWTTSGSFDVLGTRKGSFRASLERSGPRAFSYRITHVKGDQETAIESALANGTYTVRVPSRDQEGSQDVAPEADVFVFDSLVWACTIDLGGVLARHEAAGTLVRGTTLYGVAGSGAVAFEGKVLSSETVTQALHGESVALRITKVNLPPNVDITLVCNPEGVPLRIDIPAQHIVVRMVGFEDVEAGKPEPMTLVDKGPWRERLSQPAHAVSITKDVDVPMRDGVLLRADVYVPEGTGPFPTILARTPYDKMSEGALKGSYYAERGYAFVAQDVRGRFASDGDWVPLLNEARDGFDTLTWIAKQDWSNGNVGMIGASYVGLVQWLAAKTGHPALKCIAPQVSPPDPHENFPYEGGCFMLAAAWWSRVVEAMEEKVDWSQGLDWQAMYETLPLSDMDDALNLEGKSFLDEWLAHPPEDPYWNPAAYQGEFANIDVPAFHVSGWFDGDMPGAIQNFPGMRKHAKSERARDGQYLVLGPWTHFFNTQRKLGDVDFGEEAVIDLDSRILRFFDRYLKGVQNGIEDEDRVFAFAMGANTWRAASDWPLPGTTFTKLYLASGGHAARRDGDGRLRLEAATDGVSHETYRYDPMDLPELDIDWTDLSGNQITEDQNERPDREDDLDYVTPPFATDCEIIGPVVVKLWVSTDALDTDFACGLSRVTRDGKRLAIRGGVQRLRYAQDPRKDQPVTPGTIVEVTVDLWATGIRLQAGERLQLTVTSQVWPSYGRNLNTLESPLTAKEGVVATNTIHHDADHPSALVLPVVPRADAPGLSF
ncbi:MAG: CocE/NonD family hydrolase [Planctomycetes bacterium]|nr:CocE/NonD family hydrolase [Planctomycetota bacterium]